MWITLWKWWIFISFIDKSRQWMMEKELFKKCRTSCKNVRTGFPSYVK